MAPDPVTPADLAAAEKLDKKKLRMHSNFEELLKNYLEASSGAVEDPADRLKELLHSVHSLTRLSSFRELSVLTYGGQNPSLCNIVSSIEFDKDGEFFAIAGNIGKIKVCIQTPEWLVVILRHCLNSSSRCSTTTVCCSMWASQTTLLYRR